PFLQVFSAGGQDGPTAFDASLRPQPASSAESSPASNGVASRRWPPSGTEPLLPLLLDDDVPPSLERLGSSSRTGSVLGSPRTAPQPTRPTAIEAIAAARATRSIF